MRDPPGADSAEPLRREDDCRGAAVGPMEGSVFRSLSPDHCHRRCLPLGEGRQYRQAGVLVAIRWTATITRHYGSGGLLHQVSLIRIAGACGVLRLLGSSRAGPNPQGVAAADASIPAPHSPGPAQPPAKETHRGRLSSTATRPDPVAAALEVIRELDLSMTRGRTWRRVERARALTLAPVPWVQPWDPARCVNAPQRFRPLRADGQDFKRQELRLQSAVRLADRPRNHRQAER